MSKRIVPNFTPIQFVFVGLAFTIGVVAYFTAITCTAILIRQGLYWLGYSMLYAEQFANVGTWTIFIASILVGVFLTVELFLRLGFTMGLRVESSQYNNGQ
ncbi:MAG: hypothetical protein V4436_02635 [Patescibacteria group bacterium]